MGTWSTDAFGNDEACDWVYDLVVTEDLSAIEAAIDAVERGPDASAAVEALAAIETIARLRGHPGARSAYTERLDDWVLRTRLMPPEALMQRALAAIAHILGEDSELKELWDETPDAQAWIESVRALQSRLLAPPAPLEAAPEAHGDHIAALIRRAGTIRFAVPDVAPESPVGALYNAVMAADALSDAARVREIIGWIWQPVAQLGKPGIAWDLAVREAKTWANEGLLDEALAGLEAWRGAAVVAGPGQFEIRAAGLCVNGRDLDRARALRAVACAAAPDPSLWHLDAALLEARLGSVALAREILATHADAFDNEKLKPVVDFIQGILACRDHDPLALDLLTRASEEYLEKSETGSPASWSLFSICAGWWALALHQAGRSDDARALVSALRTILLQPYNLELLAELKQAGLLPPGAEAPPWPLPAQAHSVFQAGSRDTTDHGVFKTVQTRGVNALTQVEAYRRDFAGGSKRYPFLIGDADDLARLLDAIEPAADGGRATLEQARALDATAWLEQHSRKAKPRWPKDGPEPVKMVLSQFKGLPQILKPVMFIGLIELDDPCELFARMGYGDWNACPPPHVHAALHRHWRAQFGAEPIAISNDVVEYIVASPPQSRSEALDLARAHEAYCPDVVEQGVGSTGKLASSLLGAPYWYFWWD
ncbi:hypothetical protein GCM10025771_24390 [Niveibacterium umoris]|uniref:DUF4253 domain-containing protein n=1 Tax=Niveibacterium umoris TaxID=1193620 RepID=A0A840BL64_9RHOO|nr:DUF4253 domain-containing protein [Niveibacterium umoris]MBB4012372.1 hypothetical protein [Niveibacterium umoris]